MFDRVPSAATSNAVMRPRALSPTYKVFSSGVRMWPLGAPRSSAAQLTSPFGVTMSVWPGTLWSGCSAKMRAPMSPTYAVPSLRTIMSLSEPAGERRAVGVHADGAAASTLQQLLALHRDDEQRAVRQPAETGRGVVEVGDDRVALHAELRPALVERHPVHLVAVDVAEPELAVVPARALAEDQPVDQNLLFRAHAAPPVFASRPLVFLHLRPASTFSGPGLLIGSVDAARSRRMGDVDAAFTAFVQMSGSRSLRLAVLLAGDVGAGQDLLQTVHEQLYKRWRRHGGPAAPEPYVRKALVNAATSCRLRRLHARETLVSQAPEGGSYEMGPDVLLREHLLPALKRLSARQRSVLVLRYFADLTETETADQLGCTVGTVKTLASRALRRLREDPILAAAMSTTEA